MECIGEIEVKVKPAIDAEDMYGIFSDLVGKLASLAAGGHILASGPSHGNTDSQTMKIPVRYNYDGAISNACEYGLLVSEQAVAEVTDAHDTQYDVLQYRSIMPQNRDFGRYY